MTINGCAKLTNPKGLKLVILTKQSMRLVISLAVKQNMKEFLMMMRNMWWHFSFFFRSDKFSFGPTGCLGFSICLCTSLVSKCTDCSIKRIPILGLYLFDLYRILFRHVSLYIVFERK